jgi:hypothetical protein
MAVRRGGGFAQGVPCCFVRRSRSRGDAFVTKMSPASYAPVPEGQVGGEDQAGHGDQPPGSLLSRRATPPARQADPPQRRWARRTPELPTRSSRATT